MEDEISLAVAIFSFWALKQGTLTRERTTLMRATF